jgi:hypothetical protein
MTKAVVLARFGEGVSLVASYHNSVVSMNEDSGVLVVFVFGDAIYDETRSKRKVAFYSRAGCWVGGECCKEINVVFIKNCHSLSSV